MADMSGAQLNMPAARLTADLIRPIYAAAVDDANTPEVAVLISIVADVFTLVADVAFAEHDDPVLLEVIEAAHNWAAGWRDSAAIDVLIERLAVLPCGSKRPLSRGATPQAATVYLLIKLAEALKHLDMTQAEGSGVRASGSRQAQSVAWLTLSVTNYAPVLLSAAAPQTPIVEHQDNIAALVRQRVKTGST